MSTIILGSELKADLVLIDDSKGRRAAQERGLAVLGCVGVLEDACGVRLLSAEAYRQLLTSGAYVDPKVLQASLKRRRLPPL